MFILGNALLIARVATTPNASNRASMTPFQAEMQRRRLWACYLMTAYSSEPHLQRYTFQLVKDIGLPCQDEDFNPEMASPTPPGSNERQSVSLAGELIKIICLWQVYPMSGALEVRNDKAALANFTPVKQDQGLRSGPEQAEKHALVSDCGSGTRSGCFQMASRAPVHVQGTRHYPC